MFKLLNKTCILSNQSVLQIQYTYKITTRKIPKHTRISDSKVCLAIHCTLVLTYLCFYSKFPVRLFPLITDYFKGGRCIDFYRIQLVTARKLVTSSSGELYEVRLRRDSNMKKTLLSVRTVDQSQQ